MMLPRHQLSYRFFVLGLTLLCCFSFEAAQAMIQFNRDIRPILSDACYQCHGPDKATRKAKLRLDTEEGAYADRNGSRAIVPGRPEESEVLKRLTTHDPDEVMPPADSPKKLKPEQILLIKEWIKQGAKYEGHWAYIPPVKSAIPRVDNASWVVNPIDSFILARLEKEKISPSKPADKRTLIRRLSFDLRGLPPSPAEVESFIKDRRPNAYDLLVEKFLSSAHYGERMAMHWLDLVRYADTVGYHGDNNFSVWPYRDYVINAFNSNFSFDRFTKEQIAGDLLPNATIQQKVASGYNRLNRISTEGGVQDKEYLAKYAADRVRTTSAIWLGGTMGCAECHDHKFDPYTAKDFYQFQAFFADLNEKGFYSDGFGRNDWGPKIALAPEKDKARVQELDQQISAVRQELERVSDEHLAGELVEWEKKVLEGEASGTLEWNHPKPTSIESSGGATLMIQDDQSVLSSGSNPQIDDYTITVPVPLGRLTAIRLESLRDESLLGNSIARSGTTFYISEVVAELISSTRESQPIKISHAFADYAQDGFPVLGTIDQNSSTAWAVEGGHAGTKRAVFVPEEPLNIPEGSHLKVTIRHSRKHPRQHIGRFRIGVTSNEFSGVDRFGISEDVLKAIKTPASERKEDQQKAITAAYRRVSPSLKVNRVTLARLEAERNQITGQWPTTLVSQSKEPRTIRVLPRGNWMDDSGEEVGPAVPGFLPQLETSGRPSRLDLAHWFTSRENPLTARVFVNRLWKLYFGTGISKTLDDFGAQGEWPTHPELLDWLATEFMDTGWNIKQMVRTMVLSRTYRQASTSSRELDEKDPYNRLLARQSRFRLDAELVRDNALAISGLLVDKQGGPSTHPYQPPGYYAALNFPKREYVEDVSEGLYRRGLYVHWQRTFLHPSLLAFDAPSREECTVNRVNSNTPLQALVLLNDPTYVEAARVFAANLVREQKGFQPRLNLAFAKTVARSPSRKETELLKKLFEKEFKQYSKSTDAAHQLLSVGEAPVATDLNPAEVAAWTSVTRSLLNLHETITRN